MDDVCTSTISQIRAKSDVGGNGFGQHQHECYIIRHFIIVSSIASLMQEETSTATAELRTKGNFVTLAPSEPGAKSYSADGAAEDSVFDRNLA